MPRARLTAFLLVAALAAAGCGDDDGDRGNVKIEGGTSTAGETATSAETTGTTETAPTGPAAATITVRETEYELDPKDPQIAKAGIVAFRIRNAGQITHALEVEGSSGERETEGIEPGGSATLRVDLAKAGRYKWYCPIGDHEQRGMEGVITVAGGGSSRGDDRGGERTTTDEDDGGGKGGSPGRGGGGSNSGGAGAGGY